MKIQGSHIKDFFNIYKDPKIRERIQELRIIDQKVRQHEMAHKIVGGQYAGAVHFEYVRGPDGRLYAVAGEVEIDTSEAPTPEETIKKMEQVKRAALAPPNPSSQDRRVAAIAEAKRRKAELELMQNGNSKNIDISV